MTVKLMKEAKMSSIDKQVLRSRLDNFYGTVTDYMAFSSVSNQIGCWQYIGEEIAKQLTQNGGKHIRILEVGAGRSGFGEWLQTIKIRDKVQWTAQDVTVANAAWLQSQADCTLYGDINEIPLTNKYDIIFSTYVLEHVTNPEQHLNFLHSLLLPAGKLFIFCPRYDMPGYLCPSSRHLNLPNRLSLATKSILLRLRSLITRQPAFLVQTDLAAFYQPFFPDADAVHWVSLLDLKLWANNKGSQFRKLKSDVEKFGSKNWMVKQFLTCAVAIQKQNEQKSRQ